MVGLRILLDLPKKGRFGNRLMFLSKYYCMVTCTKKGSFHKQVDKGGSISESILVPFVSIKVKIPSEIKLPLDGATIKHC